MKTSEPEVREMLRRRARAFSMDPDPPPVVVRRVRRRMSRNVALAAATLTSIGVAVAVLGGSFRTTAPEDAVDAGSGLSQTPVKLVSYLVPDAGGGDRGVIVGDELSDHVACMRAAGFDLPDPVQTADGWSILVDPSQVDIGSAEWREAAFVTCRLPVPASGNFILGLSKDRVDRFVACVREQGFELPEPTLNDRGEYVFDLTGTDIDMGGPEWNRAAFVTCSPDVSRGSMAGSSSVP